MACLFTGTDETESAVVTETVSAPVPEEESGDGYDDVDAGREVESADSRTERTEQVTPPETESTDVSQSVETSALDSLEDQLLGNSSSGDVLDAVPKEKVKETSSDADVDTGEKSQEVSGSVDAATESTEKDVSETAKDDSSCMKSTDEAGDAGDSALGEKQVRSG